MITKKNRTRKRIRFVFAQLIVSLCLIGCNDSILLESNVSDNNDMELSMDFETNDNYYWYEGKRIELFLNKSFVNIVVDSAYTKTSSFKMLESNLDFESTCYESCDDLVKIYFKKNTNSLSDYEQRVYNLLEDKNIKCVLPFFERGHSADPIGTSYLFYVKLKTQYGISELKKIVGKVGLKVIKDVPYTPQWYIISMRESIFSNSIDASNYLYDTGCFDDVDPAFMFDFKPCSTVNDPLYSQQWGLKNITYPAYDINIEDAWDISTGNNVLVAVVDGSIDVTHYDLNQNIDSKCYDTHTNTFTRPLPYSYHGTHVAGTIAAVGNNSLQVAGVAYNSKIMGISHRMNVSPTASAEFASGINYAWSNGADIINNSWGDQGGQYYNNLHSTILDNAIMDAMQYGRSSRGAIVVFAAGNFGHTGAIIDYPANSNDNILVVGSIDNNGYRAYKSGYGAKLDVVAPGENIISTIVNNGVSYMNGTSMATPHVSGVAALILSKANSLTREEIVRIIELTSQKINPGGSYTYGTYYNRYNGAWNNEMGYGLVDAHRSALFAENAYIILPSSPGMNALVNGVYYPNTSILSVYLGGADKTVILELPSNLINSSYTYFWRQYTSTTTSWKPSFDYTSGSSAIVNLPYPIASTTTLNVTCHVYDGTTLVATPKISLLVNP